MSDFWQKILHEFQTPFKDSVLIFSVILFIILLAPVVLKRLRIPSIIVLIISGIVIGPHGLYLIERNSAVNLFSTIGLLYIMFIAGLELDLGEFKKNRNKSFVFGLLTFIVPISLGLPVCYYLLGYALNTSVLTASMFATHTLIAYPIVSRMGISKTEAVAITVGGTIFTDTAVLMILAVIAGVEEGGLSVQLWARLGISVLIFLVIVVFAIPRIAAWFFRQLEDEKNSHFIFVLSIVFFCAFLAELSGLEPIIGAFAAGLTLNRLIPHSSSLMNRIEFVGNSLFIPFFLISVGMLIDISVLTNGAQALLVAAALTLVALGGKWIAAYCTGWIFDYTTAQRKLIFGLSSAHAAATLAVILVGYQLGIIDDNILNGTIVLILVTCLVASFATEDAGRKVALQADADEGHGASVGDEQRILVPIANPATMERLIDFAFTLKEDRSRFPVVALTIVDDDEKAQAKLLQARKMLEKVISHAAAADQTIEIIATIDRNVTNGIKRVARERFITDIVMGWPGKTRLAEIIFGKTFDSIVNQTSQGIFITRFTLPLNVHRSLQILCPPLVEKETGFYKWLSKMFRLARQLNLKITFLATVNTYNEIANFMSRHKLTVDIGFKECNDLGNLMPLQQKFHENDIIALASSRKGGISYTPFLDILPKKMIRSFSDNSLIFIYPEVESVETLSSFTQDTESGLLERGLDLIRSAKGIFRKE